MTEDKQPICYIVAGPNGAGKTTFALSYLPKFTNCRIFLNADEIAHGLSPLDVAAAQMEAGRILLKNLDQCIKERRDFALETTLSGKGYFKRAKQLKQDDWRIVLHYLWLPSAALSESRVRGRVLQGGHNVPLEDIVRRYPRSINHFWDFIQYCDEVYCYDNSQEAPQLIFSIFDGEQDIFNSKMFERIQEK